MSKMETNLKRLQQRALAGDASAFAEFMRDYGSLFARIVRRQISTGNCCPLVQRFWDQEKRKLAGGRVDSAVEDSVTERIVARLAEFFLRPAAQAGLEGMGQGASLAMLAAPTVALNPPQAVGTENRPVRRRRRARAGRATLAYEINLNPSRKFWHWHLRTLVAALLIAAALGGWTTQRIKTADAQTKLQEAKATAMMEREKAKVNAEITVDVGSEVRTHYFDLRRQLTQLKRTLPTTTGKLEVE